MVIARDRNENGVADVVCFLAYSGLRIGEAMVLDRGEVDQPVKVAAACEAGEAGNYALGANSERNGGIAERHEEIVC